MKNVFVGFVFSLLNYVLAFCHWLIKGRDFKEVSNRWCQFTDDFGRYPLLQKCGFEFARLFVHTVPHVKLRLLMDIPEQCYDTSATTLNSLREYAWLRSLQFPIRSLGNGHDSAKEALVMWLRWQNTYLAYYANRYGIGPNRQDLATTRLQEFLDQNISPHFMLQELIEVMISERVPQFLMEVLVKDCLARLRQHPLDSVCPDDHLTKLLTFLADSSWTGFDELRRECVLIALACAQILGHAHHVEALLSAAGEANPYRKPDLEKMLAGVGATVSANKP